MDFEKFKTLLINFFKDHVKQYIWALLALSTVILLAFPGMTALSELSSRDKELEYLENQRVNILVEIVSNLQVHSNHADKEDGLVLVSLDKKLLKRKQDIDNKYSCLSNRIIKGSNECEPKAEGMFAEFNTNGLLIRLLFFAALAGSVLSLLWGKTTELSFREIVFSLCGGVGAGIVCLLFFTSNSWVPGALGNLPVVGSSIKVLFGFLAGLFSGKLLGVLSYGVDKVVDKARNAENLVN